MNTAVIQESSRQKIAQTLSRLLADTYVLYVKTQNFHWNVTDPRFYSLHKFFEDQYQSLAEANDEIAERIRALQQRAPGSMEQFLKLTSLAEADNSYTAETMLQQLVEDHETLSNYLRSSIPEMQKLKDEGTADLFIQRLRFHEKSAWMLRSHLPNAS